MQLIVDLDDGTGRDKLMEILDTLSAYRPYVRTAIIVASYDPAQVEPPAETVA
jgi:hypothetical protein